MKYPWKVAICCASALALNTGLCAIGGSSDPYEPIVTRNVFDLNPPQAITPPPPEPPSKITPDGIMTIFGTKQALFYVDVPPHPPQPATQKSYILSEGQSEDDIEVTRIDEKTGVITFNNHGVVQEIPLVKAPPITTPTPVVMRSTPDMRPAFGRDFNTGRGEQPSMNNVTKLTPEERMVIIAAEKAKAKQEGNPIWKIFPPTDLDEAAGTVNSTSDTPPSP